MQVDLPLDRLVQYEYPHPEPADFDAFWSRTLQEHRAHPLDPRFEPVDALVRTIDVYDVTFAGYAGDDVKGWLLLPHERTGPLPLVVEYLGYGSGRGHPVESLAYASAGFAHAIMDSRGQGSSVRAGHTADPHGAGPSAPGFMTRDILDPERYYYRRLFTDAYRFVDAVATHEAVARDRIAVTGRSQGGAMALVAAGLRDDVRLAMPHVPFLSAFRRAVQVTDHSPHGEIIKWLAAHRGHAERAFATLAYFDAVSFARRATCPGRFCVALHDVVSPPSTVFAAYNAFAGPKEMTVWQFNGHEAGGPEDTLRTIRAVRELVP
ncbi:acetylxylan esterase [Dactylosporangium sp. NPDC051485]|uniref:acetylxylan esterase n=1 Tax=Dactylosporangium sp. NPDC051485 TaxID=3154846 RepID=UPI00343F5185